MTLHDDIANIAKSNPAVYIGAETLSGICFDAFKSQIETMRDVSIPMWENIPTLEKKFYAKLLTANTVNGSPAKDIRFGLVEDSGSIYLKAFGGIKLAVEYGAIEQTASEINYPKTRLGQIYVLVDDVHVQLTVNAENISASPSSAIFIPNIEREDKFDDICNELNIEELQVSRLEGMIAYSGIQTIVSSLLREPQNISLLLLFPGINLLGSIEAIITPGRESIVIIPESGFGIRPGSPCECADVSDGFDRIKGGTFTPEGKITLGGPTAKLLSNVNLGPRYEGIGETGFYIPIALAETITRGPPPITKTSIGQNGFIGWDAEAVVEWKFQKTWFDQARGAIMVRWSASHGDTFAAGQVWVDLGKLGKFDVSTFIAKQQPTPSTFTVALFPDPIAGIITLRPIVEHIDMGEFFIEPSIKSLALAPFGDKLALIAFIAEAIMSRIVAHNIPIELRRKLGNYLSGLSWKIEDLSYWGIKSNSIKPYLTNPAVLWHAKQESMLISGKFID